MKTLLPLLFALSAQAAQWMPPRSVIGPLAPLSWSFRGEELGWAVFFTDSLYRVTDRPCVLGEIRMGLVPHDPGPFPGVQVDLHGHGLHLRFVRYSRQARRYTLHAPVRNPSVSEDRWQESCATRAFVEAFELGAALGVSFEAGFRAPGMTDAEATARAAVEVRANPELPQLRLDTLAEAESKRRFRRILEDSARLAGVKLTHVLPTHQADALLSPRLVSLIQRCSSAAFPEEHPASDPLPCREALEGILAEVDTIYTPTVVNELVPPGAGGFNRRPGRFLKVEMSRRVLPSRYP